MLSYSSIFDLKYFNMISMNLLINNAFGVLTSPLIFTLPPPPPVISLPLTYNLDREIVPVVVKLQFESIVKIKSKYLIEYSRIEKIYPIEDLEYANSLVAFYLMVEDLDPNSSIRPYLDSLPKSTDEFVFVCEKQFKLKSAKEIKMKFFIIIKFSIQQI